jgi:hypothetical protein
MTVTELTPILTLGDMMDRNADLMTQVYHDNGLSADEKLRSFTLGIRNQCALSRDLRDRRAELARYQQVTVVDADALQALRFKPPPPPERLPVPAASPPAIPAPAAAPTTPTRPTHSPD